MCHMGISPSGDSRLVFHRADDRIELKSQVESKPGPSADATHGAEADRQMHHATVRQKQSANRMRQVTRQMRRFIKF